MLSIQRYIRKYGLDAAISDFKLKMREYDSKFLLKYDQLESSMGNPEVQDCRGLVLEKDTLKIKSLGYRKFFNNGEGHAAKIDWNSANILMKCDGTFIQCYYDWNLNIWQVGTTGTAEGEGVVHQMEDLTFASLFWKTVEQYGFNTCLLDTNNVYIFELMTPYNIVVTPHSVSSAVLTGVRNRIDLSEYSYSDLLMIGESLGVPVVKAYDLNKGNFGHLIRTFETMPFTEEGYVVVDGNFNRVKVKNPAYCAVHHLKGKMAEHNIMSVIKTNEVDEMIATFPDRRDEILSLQVKYNTLLGVLEDAWDVLQGSRPKNITPKERKKFALAVNEMVKNNDLGLFRGLFFGLEDGKVDNIKSYLFNSDDKKLYHYIHSLNN